MAEFVLKYNYFQFVSNVKHQISGTAIGTKYVHHMRVNIWTTWRISFSKMNKSNLGFSSGTLIIFFSFGQPVKKNLMIFWNHSTIFILI